MAASDYAGMLAMIADGRIAPDRLVGEVVDLEGAAAALVAMDGPAASAGIVVAQPAR
jgi:alcohol dehydrogenase